MKFLQLLSLQVLLTIHTVCSSLGDTWTSLHVNCIPQSAALHHMSSLTDLHCSVLASEKISTSGILVAQFNRLNRTCSIFLHQSVCRQLEASDNSDCQVFVRYPIDQQLIKAINPNLTNVWLGDRMSRFENLICQVDEDTSKLHPVGVSWTDDGASFDGVSSHMILNKSSITFANGLTVLIRMKRKPQVQALIEFKDCSAFPSGAVLSHIWEHDVASKGYAKINNIKDFLPQRYITTDAPLPSSANEWVNFGFTTTPSANYWGLFVNDAFRPNSSISVAPSSGSSTPNNFCFHFGLRPGNSKVFDGTVRAIAIANVAMSETDIRQFFSNIV